MKDTAEATPAVFIAHAAPPSSFTSQRQCHDAPSRAAPMMLLGLDMMTLAAFSRRASRRFQPRRREVIRRPIFSIDAAMRCHIYI